MTVKEIREKIEAKKVEVRSAIDKADAEIAKKLNEELRGLKDNLKIAEELEEEDKRALEEQAEKEKRENGKNKKAKKRDTVVDEDLQYRAINKWLLRKADNAPQLSEQERASINVGNNGAILPQGFINQLQVLTKGFPALKPYCHVIPVTTNTGKMPISQGSTTRKLAKLATDTEMVKEMITSTPIEFTVDDYGKILPVENDVLADTGVDLYNGMIAPDFAECKTNTENAEILALIKTNATAGQAGTDYKAIIKTLNKNVLPSLKSNTIILTNQSGFDYLDELVDGQGRPLLNTNISGDSVTTFKGRPIVTLDDADLIPVTEGKMPFYIVNPYALIKFFDRQAIEIATSTEAGFTLNQTFVRVIERFDAQKGDTRCDFYVEL